MGNISIINDEQVMLNITSQLNIPTNGLFPCHWQKLALNTVYSASEIKILNTNKNTRVS